MKKNPWLAGILNVVIPGLGWFYTHGLLYFILHLILNLVIGAALLLAGALLLAPVLGLYVFDGSSLSPQAVQSLAVGAMGLFFVLYLFAEGHGSARMRNKKLAASAAAAGPPPEQEPPEARLRKLQAMLNDGLISPEDYEAKKADILSRM